ncbi:hypothetical protein [Bacillus toyonensis]|uniref:hypothetical protein n=1 Tax=Bacillus toyonensis TaxID=155322 RepID=UPI002E1A7A35|nr:hypothetical protein [Bacillus toyonensis]
MKWKSFALMACVCFLLGVLSLNFDVVQKYTFADKKIKIYNTNEKVGTGITVLPNK